MSPSNQGPKGMLFRIVFETSEGAFRILLPHGWIAEGGIYRQNLLAQQTYSISQEPKFNYLIKNDNAGSVVIRWCPEINYYDPHGALSSSIGSLPVGSLFQGMLVYPQLTPPAYLQQIIFPWAHVRAEQVEVVDQRLLPDLAAGYQKSLSGLPQSGFSGATYAAGVLTTTYMEDGVRYLEKLFTVIVSQVGMAKGMWSNQQTLYIRAPANEFEAWLPVLYVIQNSMRINPEWLARELSNQADLTPDDPKSSPQEIARWDLQINNHQQWVITEIQTEAFLSPAVETKYINPFSGQIEVASAHWRYRWVTQMGDEFYTDEAGEDPRSIRDVNRSEWKRCDKHPGSKKN